MPMEFYNDKVPMYVHNKHTSYENTVLQEHASIVSKLADTNTTDTLIESQGRLLIGMCMKGEAQRFIDDKYHGYYEKEFSALDDSSLTATDKMKAATTRAWIRLINEAMDRFIGKYKVDGSKAKIAVISAEMPDGRVIADIDDVPALAYTSDEQGL